VNIDGELQLWLSVSLLAAAYILVRHWRSGLGAGLMFTYVCSFLAMHWLAPAMYLLPWYTAPGVELTIEGLRLSALALLALGVGAEIGAIWFYRRGPEVPRLDRRVLAEPRAVNLYMAAGAVFYGGIFPLVAGLPTASALASTGSSLMVLGLALKAWNAWQQEKRLRVWSWLVASAAFPIITVVGQGFLGFGFAAMLVVTAFVASFYRPRWHVVIAALLVSYLGLSVYVTYMRDRREIRAVVWGGEAIGTRMDQLSETFAAAEWFDFENLDHLRRVDDRLNQNYLVGAAVTGIESGIVPLAYGTTISDAAIALVPRALWPGKPVVAGSGDLVADYTGITFAEGTSVGIGHVMEWYVNFGSYGVALGFLLIGAVVVFVDRAASVWLHYGDVGRFVVWFLPGLSLLQVGGSFVEMTSSAAAGLVVALTFRKLSGHFIAHRDDALPDEPPAVSS
jgi:hypothetical protein